MKNKNHCNCFCIMMVVLLAVCGELRAESNRAAGNGMTCQRFLLCTANAYGYIGEESDASAVKDRVAAAAVQFAERKINTYLKDLLTQRETYRFPVDGKMNFQLLSTKKIESGQTGKNLLGMQIAGMVEYQIDGSANDDFLTVSVDSDKSIYNEGDELLFLLQGNQNAHMCLVEDAPDKTVTQLLPNRFKADDSFAHGQHLFPSEVSGDIFSFIVGPPFGQSVIHMFGSDAALGGIAALDEESGDFIQTTESIDTIRSKLMQNVIEVLRSNESQITFQCAQFVESQKNLSIRP